MEINLVNFTWNFAIFFPFFFFLFSSFYPTTLLSSLFFSFFLYQFLLSQLFQVLFSHSGEVDCGQRKYSWALDTVGNGQRCEGHLKIKMAAWPCRAYSPTTGSVRHAESADFNTCVLKESSAFTLRKFK